MGGEVGRPVSRCADAISCVRAVHHGARARSGVHMVRFHWGALGAPCLALVWFACAACGPSVSGGGSSADAGAAGTAAGATCPSRFATSVESFTAGPGPTTGQAELPDIVLGPPKGGGAGKGSLDVVTLGNGGSITLG